MNNTNSTSVILNCVNLEQLVYAVRSFKIDEMTVMEFGSDNKVFVFNNTLVGSQQLMLKEKIVKWYVESKIKDFIILTDPCKEFIIIPLEEK